MKLVKWIVVVFVTTVISHAAPAQLLKKLKEKAEKTLEGKNRSGGSAGSASPSTSSSGSITGEASKQEQLATAPSNGKIVFSLAADEQFLYDETSIKAISTGVSYQFVTHNKKYEYFLINDGIRTGPFKTAPLKSMNATESEASNDNDNNTSMGDQLDPIAARYTKTISGKLHIVFNGKNYGPYDHVSKMIVSPDQKQFFASVTSGGANSMTTKMGVGNSYIVSSAGIKKQAGTGNAMPMKFYVSEGFNHGMLVVMEQTNQKVITVTSTGKQIESSMMDAYTNNKMMVSDKGDIISIPSQSPTQILVNGNEAASFKVPIEQTSRLFITPDISKSVYYDKGKIYRADGSEMEMTGIVYPKVVSQGNITAVYYFKIFKNESGIKDVYLCKKEI